MRLFMACVLAGMMFFTGMNCTPILALAGEADGFIIAWFDVLVLLLLRPLPLPCQSQCQCRCLLLAALRLRASLVVV